MPSGRTIGDLPLWRMIGQLGADEDPFALARIAFEPAKLSVCRFLNSPHDRIVVVSVACKSNSGTSTGQGDARRRRRHRVIRKCHPTPQRVVE